MPLSTWKIGFSILRRPKTYILTDVWCWFIHN